MAGKHSRHGLSRIGSPLQPANLLTGLPNRFTIYDLEFTAWEGSQARAWSGPGEHREVIQIGALVIETANGCTELRSLRLHVRPQINPVLSDYIVQLTGVRQQTIDEEGIPFPQAMELLNEFVDSDRPLVCCGLDADVLSENCAIHGIGNAFDVRDLVNIRPRIAAAYCISENAIVSSELPQLLGSPSAGQAHDALEDCRAIAHFLRVSCQPTPGSGT